MVRQVISQSQTRYDGTSASMMLLQNRPEDVVLSDEQLMQRIQQGDHQSFSELVNRHSRRFYAVAYRLLLDRQEAEDMVQEAFLKLWRSPAVWSEGHGAKFTTWFYRVVMNLCHDHQKKSRPELMHEEEFPDIVAEDDTEQYLIDKEQQQALQQAMKALPERQRTALALCFYEELSNQEAAELMGIHLKALQSLVMRAKESLKQKLYPASRSTSIKG